MKTKLLLLFIFFIFIKTNAEEIHVPEDYLTIQEAIDASLPGDIIIVNNGTYYENIDFLGFDITVTSNYYYSGDLNDIVTTIIDGSQSDNSDRGSCVTFNTDETENSILMGFTITGGTGTKTANEGTFFRTGGGILIDYASPTIKNNIIRDNECIAEEGVSGAGGGGIRMGYGNPIIRNNVIKNNLGGYAGGIMIAFCGGTVLKNNLIVNNTATGSFNGGGGVYIDWQSITLENNTIANNHSGDRGGGIISTGTTTIIKNCILYGNTADNGSSQIFNRFSGTANVTYSVVEGGYDGSGNEVGMITDDPLFLDTENYILDSSSPCIDSGNSDSQYNDIEDPDNTGNALYPSQGSLHNDMGVYGGQGVESILSINETNFIGSLKFSYTNPFKTGEITIKSSKSTSVQVDVYNLLGQKLQATQKVQLNQGDNNFALQLTTTSLIVFESENGEKKTIKLIK